MKVDVSFPSAHMFLGVPDAVMQELGSELPFSQTELDELSTSIIEACTNAIEHGNGLEADVPTKVTFEFTQNRFEVSIYDRGQGFEAEGKDFGEFPPDLMQERGRGIFMMNAFCDELHFSRENGFFVCKLVKIPKGKSAVDDEEE